MIILKIKIEKTKKNYKYYILVFTKHDPHFSLK